MSDHAVSSVMCVAVMVLAAVKSPAYQINYGTGKDVSDESIADAGRPLQVRWHGASFIDVPLRDGALPAELK